MSDNQKREIINNLNLIADRVETDWQKLTVCQVNALNDGIEATWQAICKRAKK